MGRYKREKDMKNKLNIQCSNQLKSILIIPGLTLFVFTGCSSKQADGDMQLNIHNNVSGATIREGDAAGLQVVEKTEEGVILNSSYDYSGYPTLTFREKSVFNNDFFSALGMLSEGDSATFRINIESLVTKQNKPRPANIKGKYLIYSVKVDKVIPRDHTIPGRLSDSLLQDRIQRYEIELIERARQSELAKIANYISLRRLKPIVTASGLNYLIIKKGDGPIAVKGDSVALHFTSRFLSGKIFQTTREETARKENIYIKEEVYKPYKTEAGTGRSIQAFEEAMLLFPKGTKATLILSSKLLYKGDRFRNVDPFTPIICEIEIVNVMHQRKGKPGGAQNNR